MAALLLATFPPHVNFSRIGLNNVADPLFGTLALAFLARGLQSRRQMDFAIAGAALGLTQYFYEGGRFLFVFLVCFWLLGILLLRRIMSAFSRAEEMRPLPVRGIFTCILVALLVAAPVYYTLFALRQPFAARMDTVGLGGSYWLRAVSSGGGQSPDQQLLTPFLTFVFMPEQALYYGGEQPMVLDVLVPVLLLGAAYAVWRWRGPGMLLALWVLLTCGGNMLLTYGAIYARYVVVFPALALLLALGVREVLLLILPEPRQDRGLKPPVRTNWIMAGIVLAMAVVQTVYYFGPHLQGYNRQIRPTADFEDALFRSADFPPGTRIHLITSQTLDQSYLYGVLGFVTDSGSLSVLTPQQVTPDYLAKLPHGVDQAFYVEPGDTTSPELLAQYFRLDPPQYSPYNLPRDKQFILYYAPRG